MLTLARRIGGHRFLRGPRFIRSYPDCAFGPSCPKAQWLHRETSIKRRDRVLLDLAVATSFGRKTLVLQDPTAQMGAHFRGTRFMTFLSQLAQLDVNELPGPEESIPEDWRVSQHTSRAPCCQVPDKLFPRLSSSLGC